MGCKKLTSYENPISQLKVVPEETRSVVIIAYRIELKNGKVVTMRSSYRAQGWFTPDPAEQFANPYLAMGNNPVMYVDPDGEFIFAAVAIGFAVGAIYGYTAGQAQGATGEDLLGYTLLGGTIGGAASVIGSVAGYGVAAGFAPGANLAMVGATSGAVEGVASGSVAGMGNSLISGASFDQSLKNGAISGLISAGIGAGIGAISGGIQQAELNRQNSYLKSIENEIKELDFTASLKSSLNQSRAKAVFDGEDPIHDILKKFREIKIDGSLNTPLGDHFDLSTIKASDGWKMRASSWEMTVLRDSRKIGISVVRRWGANDIMGRFQSGIGDFGRRFGIVDQKSAGWLINLDFVDRSMHNSIRSWILSPYVNPPFYPVHPNQR